MNNSFRASARPSIENLRASLDVNDCRQTITENSPNLRNKKSLIIDKVHVPYKRYYIYDQSFTNTSAIGQ